MTLPQYNPKLQLQKEQGFETLKYRSVLMTQPGQCQIQVMIHTVSILTPSDFSVGLHFRIF